MDVTLNFAKKPSLHKLLKLESAGLLILLTFILIPYLIKLALFATFPLHYSYDEIVVTEVGKQNLPKLLDTVKAEPHPPGFYLLIKILPVHNPNITTTVITSLSLLLICFSLIYAHKRQIIEHYKLSFGLALFFSSFGFLQLTSAIKQDSVSFPLLLFFGFTVLSILKQKGSPWRNDLLLGHLLVLLLLFFGYIYYFQALLILVALTIFLKRRKLPLYLFCLQIAILLCFLLLYGSKQLAFNSSRFAWFEENSNALLSTLSIHLTASPINSFISEAPLIIFIFLLLSFAIKTKKNTLHFSIAFIILVLIAAAYISGLFVRARYMSFSFLLLSICVGWGLNTYKLRCRDYYLILSLFFVLGLSSYIATHFPISRTSSGFIDLINIYSSEKEIGFLSDHPISPAVLKIGYGLNQNVIPVSVSFPNLFEGAYELDREILKIDGHFIRGTELPELKRLLKENRLERYIYFMTIQEKEGYYDPDKLVLKTLSTSCHVEDVIPLSNKQIFFVFEECSFE